MCIAYLALGTENWPLFIAANRDEFHQRPTLTAAPWVDHPNVISGIDLEGGGTWLGITRQGRFGLLTNYREPGVTLENAPSRGDLVSDWLKGSASPAKYAASLGIKMKTYNGFNLIVGDLNTAYYISNRAPEAYPQELAPGRYVVSNHLLDTPWPKTRRLRQAFDRLDMGAMTPSLQTIFASLKDTSPANDADLPRTGLSPDLERLLSSPFIVSPNYGTRCSTVIAVHKSGRAILSEISYNSQGTATRRHDWPFEILIA